MRKRVNDTPEAEVARRWQAAAGEGSLTTAQGGTLRVLHAGRANRGAGPDFLDAVLETEDGTIRGAVEVHRRTSDWTRHGHGADPAYAGVVLHVVGHDDGAVSRGPAGAQLPLLELGATARRETGVAPAYPCAAAVAAGADPLPALDRAGDARFAAAAERIAHALGNGEPADQVMYVAVAEALGYSRNSGAFRDVAAAVPLAALRRMAGSAGTPEARAVRAEAVLIGAAGLLPSARHLPAARRRGTYVETLEREWAALGRPPALRAYRWDTSGGRPENHPVRRVAGLAHLALSWPRGGLVARLEAELRTQRPATARRLAGLVSVPRSPAYWAAHWDFGVPARAIDGVPAATGALVGPARAADIVVNVLLPFAAAHGARQGATDVVEGAWRCYRRHPPLAENWITRLVRGRTGLHEGGRRIAHAGAQQGLIAIYEGPCHALRCGDCALAQRGAEGVAGAAGQAVERG